MAVRWLLLVVLLLPAATARADLESYIERHEPAARAETVSEERVEGLTVTTLALVSQTWRGKRWRHELRVFRPEGVAGDVALLAISGSDVLGRALARVAGVPVAVLSDVPNQPLFFGKREDDLLAYTFAEYLQSGDEEWPLLFPMTKAALAAMDAVVESSARSGGPKIERFVVTGASKRGWTSWLAGVADDRVAGIVPVVFDNLSFAAQMDHQTEVWGAYSEELRDYTLRNLQSQVGTPRGAKLVAMVDPIAYRSSLGRVRKLVVNGTNDPYWPADAIRLYWDALEGEKSVLYVPNGTHGIAGEARVVAATAAFVRRVADRKPMPKLECEAGRVGERVDATIRSDEPARAARLWISRAEGADFRRARFEPIEAENRGGVFSASVTAPKSESIALFAEADYGGGTGGFTLSTPLRVESFLGS